MVQHNTLLLQVLFAAFGIAGAICMSCGSHPMPTEVPYWEELPYLDHIPNYDQFVRVQEPAEVLYSHVPEYPDSSRDAGHEGKVGIQALVDWDGRVRDVMVRVSCGHPELDESAVEAAFKCRWKPAIVDGHRVAVWVRYSVVFEVSG